MSYATSSIHNTLFGGAKKSGKDVILLGGDGSKKSSKDVILLGGARIGELLKDKKEFLIFVFSNLIVQLGITYYVMMNYKNQNSNMSNLLLLLSQIFILFILALVPMPSWLKFILFSIFSVTFGIMLSSLKNKVDMNIIKTALAGTIGIFAGMAAAGFALILFGIQLGLGFGLGLLYALLLLIIVSIVFMFMGTYSMVSKAISVVALFIFSLYVVYDTNSILQRNYYGDFITASLDYYLDIINIFVNLVNFDSS
jgi:hypothetical protein